jgi:hypothetical protein
MIYLEDRTLMGFDISHLQREAEHAATLYQEPRYRAVRRWFTAVAAAVKVERERRATGNGAFPVIVLWEPDPDVAATDADLELDLVLSSTTVVRNLARTMYARELRNAWHDLLVQLAELRDARRLDRRRRSTGALIHGPVRGWSEGPQDVDDAA